MESKSELKYIFSNINDLLKFGEAKHGGLIIFNSGVVIGILASYSNIQSLIFKPTVLIGIICFGISVFLSIISQFPNTEKEFNNKKEIQNPNLYFFGDLSHLDSKSFINEFKKIDSTFETNKLDDALINQILANARITRAKFSLFKYASYLTALGSGIIGLASIIKVVWQF